MARHLPLVVLFSTLGLYLAVLLPRLLWIDNDGVWVGQLHLWGDWPLHIAMARQLSDGVLGQPMIGGEPLRYPFFAALVSAGLLRLGTSVPVAILGPTLVFWLLLLWGMYRFWERVLERRWLPLLPICLFFFSAGLGGAAWLAEIRAQGLDAFLAPPKEYGAIRDYEWYAGNFLVGMLLPQRAFLPGMTLTIWLLAALQQANTRRQWCGIGLAAGLLPLIHVHSLLALLIFGGALLWPHRARWRELVLSLAPGAVLAVVLWLVFLRPSTPYPNFVSLRIGYQAKSPLEWVRMWWQFWGLGLPTALAGACLLPPGTLRRVAAAGGILFLLGNLILFQPIPWDNSKVFLWAYFGFSGAMAALLARFWGYKLAGKLLALGLVVTLCLTGTAELIRLQRTDRFREQLLSDSDRQLGEQLRRVTPPGTIILTGMDVTNPALWAGRPIFLGFGGWMPNFGFDHRQREQDLRSMLSGAPGTEALLRRYRIGAVLIGNGERDSWGANEDWFVARYPVIAQNASTRVYGVR